jgi:hypothetical protein
MVLDQCRQTTTSTRQQPESEPAAVVIQSSADAEPPQNEQEQRPRGEIIIPLSVQEPPVARPRSKISNQLQVAAAKPSAADEESVEIEVYNDASNKDHYFGPGFDE